MIQQVNCVKGKRYEQSKQEATERRMKQILPVLFRRFLVFQSVADILYDCDALYFDCRGALNINVRSVTVRICPWRLHTC